MEKYDVLEPDCFYHIFNGGNNKEDIFKELDNYYHFFKLLKNMFYLLQIFMLIVCLKTIFIFQSK